MNTNNDTSYNEHKHAHSNQSVTNSPANCPIETNSQIAHLQKKWEKLRLQLANLTQSIAPQTDEGYTTGFCVSSHSRRTNHGLAHFWV